MIDNIELSINDAHNYVVDAEDQLIDAKELHKSARKVKIFMILETNLYCMYFDNIAIDHNITSYSNMTN